MAMVMATPTMDIMDTVNMEGRRKEMSENQSYTTEENTMQKIDIMVLMEQALHAFKRLWWIILILIAIFADLSYFRVNRSYVPRYEAEATLEISVSKTAQALGSENYMNVVTAEQLGKVFPYILSSGILSDMIAEDLGLSYVPGQISVEVVENTNLVTLHVTASDGQTAYDVLQSVIKEYPEVARFVVGQIEIEVIDDSGVPTDTGKEYVTRGSVKKGALQGLMLGILLVVLDMFFHRTIRFPSDFQSMLHVSCLGTLPVYRVKKRRKNTFDQINILHGHVPQDYMEALRSIRTRVERRLSKNQQKTFLVTSSVPEEGKSTVAANLAVSLAQKGERVILVDCDLRNPSVQAKFGVEGSFPGIAAVLKQEVKLEKALYQVKNKNIDLKLLCGCESGSREVEILGSEQMKQLLSKLEDMADVVILDTSPSAMLNDALVLAHNVSMALYVVKYDHAQARLILEGIEELSETGIQVMGCVLNEAKRGNSHSGYGYGYGYGKYGNYGKYGYSRARETQTEENKMQ
ncbi:MAG: polysaccharide biosynthesis tyrosine autokinase [Lachnospiraceae bacterium]